MWMERIWSHHAFLKSLYVHQKDILFHHLKTQRNVTPVMVGFPAELEEPPAELKQSAAPDVPMDEPVGDGPTIRTTSVLIQHDTTISLYPYTCTYIYIYLYLFIHLFIYLFIHVFVYLFVYLFVYYLGTVQTNANIIDIIIHHMRFGRT